VLPLQTAFQRCINPRHSWQLLNDILVLSHPQEWANLRSQGIKTPEIAAWQRMPVEGSAYNYTNRAKAIYPYVLNVYNDPRFQQVAWD
jgi:hypothetical protein